MRVILCEADIGDKGNYVVKCFWATHSNLGPF